MLEKNRLNKFDKKFLFWWTTLQVLKETYSKPQDQSRTAKLCAGRTLWASPDLKRTMHLLHISSVRQLTRLVVLVFSRGL